MYLKDFMDSLQYLFYINKIVRSFNWYDFIAANSFDVMNENSVNHRYLALLIKGRYNQLTNIPKEIPMYNIAQLAIKS